MNLVQAHASTKVSRCVDHLNFNDIAEDLLRERKPSRIRATVGSHTKGDNKAIVKRIRKAGV